MLEGKTVSTKRIELLQFMYPGFELREQIFFDQDTDVIYTGPPRRDLLDILTRGTHSFISTVGLADVDLDNRDNLITLMHQKWGKEPKESVIETLRNLDEADFMKYFKKYWVLGKSSLEDSDSASVFELYKCLGKSRHDILTVYYRLRESYEDRYILSSVLSFIEKSGDTNNVASKSGKYIQMLRDFHASMGPSIKQILFQFYTMKGDEHYKTLWLLMSLGKGGML